MTSQTDTAFCFDRSASPHPLLEIPERPMRAEQAFQLDRGTRFSDDRKARDTIEMVREIQRIPEIWDDLERETTDPATYERRTTGVSHVVGRPRMAGHWALIGCAWLLQRESDVQVFYDTLQSTNLWPEAGFTDRVPSYSTTVERLSELEHFTFGFNHAAAKLWRTAMRANPHIGRHVWIDATAYESNALLHHDCEDKAACAAAGGKELPAVLERVSIDTVEDIRHDEQKEPSNAPEDNDEDDGDDADEVPPAAALYLNGDIEEEVIEALEDEAEQACHPKYARRRRERDARKPGEHFLAWPGKPFKHRYVCRDEDAGCRTYQARPGSKKQKSWVGGLKLTANDVTTGARIAHLYVPAGATEHEHYVELLERVKAILGRYPENVILDRGYNILNVHRFNAAMRIGQVIPWRKRHKALDRRNDTIPGVIDEYGVPYCTHCGAIGTTVVSGGGYEIKDGVGYLRFRCTNPHTLTCKTALQSLRYDDAPRHVQALSHERELYWELRLHGREKEHFHRVARTRHRDAGNDVDTRQKILGIGILEARGAIAGFVEIFRVCLRFGWLGDYKNKRPAIFRRMEGGKRGLDAFRVLRRKHRLDLPCGPQAEALGLVFQGELPDGWVPIVERRTLAKNGGPGRLKGKAKAPPDAPAPDEPF